MTARTARILTSNVEYPDIRSDPSLMAPVIVHQLEKVNRSVAELLERAIVGFEERLQNQADKK
jgi:hypothetical protein